MLGKPVAIRGGRKHRRLGGFGILHRVAQDAQQHGGQRRQTQKKQARRRPEEERLPAPTATATASPTPRTPAPTCQGVARPPTRRRTAARPTATATASPTTRTPAPTCKGVRDPDPKKNGCPKDVHVTEKEIVILEQVQFDTGQATIKPVSDGLLDTSAPVLNEHPEIPRSRCRATPTTRARRREQGALAERAEAVMEALVKRGIERAGSRRRATGRRAHRRQHDGGPAEEPPRAVRIVETKPRGAH